MNIETERLCLRPFEISDANDVFEYASLDSVGPMAGWTPHTSIEETKIIIDNILKIDSLAIVSKEDNKVIGSIGLMKRSEIMYEIGYVLSPLYWGFGYATEACKSIIKYAFESKIAEVLICGHFPFNVRSKRVIEKCGFHYEGILRKAFLNYDGKYIDYVRYSILLEEYMEDCYGSKI